MLEQAVIFISNSILDGFREGDGDLMDKLFMALNQQGVKIIRIIENSSELPEEKQHMLHEGNLITLREHFNETIQAIQEKLLTYLVDEKYAEKQKILYIGSRLDSVDYTKDPIIQGGSGSLYTQPFLEQIKKQGVAVIVCCLEFRV